MAIHHATRAFVAKLGLTIIEADGQFRLAQEDGTLSEDTFTSTGEITETLRSEGVAGITWEKPVAPKGPRSGVMAISYHKNYSANEHGPGCNDDLDCTLRDETRAMGDEGSIDAMDLNKLHAIGTQTGLFRATWLGLNPGMQRMNLANRIRGWLRNNEGHIAIGDKVGRFGIALRAPKEKKAKARPAAKVEAEARAA